MENALTTIAFPMHGCIYFNEDLRSLTGNVIGLDIDLAGSDDFKRLSLGPLITTELWKGSRKDMRLDRGPWRLPTGYTHALGNNENAWIKSRAKSRMNYHRSMRDPEHPRDGLDLLNQYMGIASHLVPPTTDEAATSNVLWHPDLHMDDVFVDPHTHEITRIVDWQSACVAPQLYQSAVPRMFRHNGHVREGWDMPKRPENSGSLSEDERKKVDQDLESEVIHKYYEAQVYKQAPRHRAVLQQTKSPIIRKPVWLVSGAWENTDLFFLRQSLISLQAQWHEVFPDDPSACPINFTMKELELHYKEEENMDGVGQMLIMFRDQGVLPFDGIVRPEDYDIASENCRKFKQVFIDLAESDEERELFTRLWPYQETQFEE